MYKEDLTIEEQEAARLFNTARLIEPNRAFFETLLNTYQPTVTKSSTVRIPYQENTKGRLLFHSFFDTMHMAWKKILPFGALAALLVIAVIVSQKPVVPQQSTPLTVNDVDLAIDELAMDIATEESIENDEDVTLNNELYNQFEVIYEPYEL